MGEALAGERRAVFEEIARAIGDEVAPGSHTWWQYMSVIAELGHDAARQLVREVQVVEAAGGMMTKDGSRRRTPGGVFFALAYERFGPKRARSVRARAERRFQEDMLRKFIKLLALVLPASAERSATTGAAALAPAPPPPKPVADVPAEQPAASAPTPARRPAPKPERRREQNEVEVVVARRRPAAGASPAAKPGPSTPKL